MGFFSKLGITGSSNKDEAQIYCGSIYNINPEYTYKEGEHTQDDIRGKFVERIMFRLLNDDPKHVVEIITGKKIPLVFDNYNKNPNVSTFMYLGKESTPRTIAYQTTPTKAYDPYKLAEYTERNWAFIPAYVDNVLTYLAEHPDVELYKEFLDLHLEKGELYAKGYDESSDEIKEIEAKIEENNDLNDQAVYMFITNLDKKRTYEHAVNFFEPSPNGMSHCYSSINIKTAKGIHNKGSMDTVIENYGMPSKDCKYSAEMAEVILNRIAKNQKQRTLENNFNNTKSAVIDIIEPAKTKVEEKVTLAKEDVVEVGTNLSVIESYMKQLIDKKETLLDYEKNITNIICRDNELIDKLKSYYFAIDKHRNETCLLDFEIQLYVYEMNNGINDLIQNPYGKIELNGMGIMETIKKLVVLIDSEMDKVSTASLTADERATLLEIQMKYKEILTEDVKSMEKNLYKKLFELAVVAKKVESLDKSTSRIRNNYSSNQKEFVEFAKKYHK